MTHESLNALPEEVFIHADAETRFVWIDGQRLFPQESQKIRNHSPNGFNWGYGGSGPAQLALAILLRFMPTLHDAQKYYQSFKFAVVASWPQNTNLDIVVNFRKEIKAIVYE